MPSQLISYDLRKPGRDYESLFGAIKALGTWWHCLESVWIVATSMTSAQVRDELQPYVDQNDKVLVTGLNGNWATLGLDQNCTDWLQKNV